MKPGSGYAFSNEAVEQAGVKVTWQLGPSRARLSWCRKGWLCWWPKRRYGYSASMLWDSEPVGTVRWVWLDQ